MYNWTFANLTDQKAIAYIKWTVTLNEYIWVIIAKSWYLTHQFLNQKGDKNLFQYKTKLIIISVQLSPIILYNVETVCYD